MLLTLQKRGGWGAHFAPLARLRYSSKNLLLEQAQTVLVKSPISVAVTQYLPKPVLRGQHAAMRVLLGRLKIRAVIA